MKKLACEMCGSTNIVKKEGLWCCQSCGAKYSPEKAKKMMVEGTVKVDSASNHKKIAKNAFFDDKYEMAYNLYRRVIELDADDLESVYIVGLIYYLRESLSIDNLSEYLTEILFQDKDFNYLSNYIDDEIQEKFAKLFFNYIISDLNLLNMDRKSIESSKQYKILNAFHFDEIKISEYNEKIFESNKKHREERKRRLEEQKRTKEKQKEFERKITPFAFIIVIGLVVLIGIAGIFYINNPTSNNISINQVTVGDLTFKIPPVYSINDNMLPHKDNNGVTYNVASFYIDDIYYVILVADANILEEELQNKSYSPRKIGETEGFYTKISFWHQFVYLSNGYTIRYSSSPSNDSNTNYESIFSQIILIN